MSYRVDVKPHDRGYAPMSFQEMYFGDIGKSFQSLSKAFQYFLQFEDWEQPMLEIREEEDDEEIPF